MKKFLIFVCVLVVLVAAGLYAVSRMVSVEKVEAMAKATVKEKTGRDLGIGGAHLMFWPSIGVRLTDVTLSNPTWAKQKQMVALGELDVSLAVKPLLQRRIEVRNFSVKNPVVHLEVAADGRKSWEFKTAAAAPGAAASDSGKAAAGSDTGTSGLPQGMTVTMGKFLISGGQLSYDDAQKNAHYAAKNFSLAVTWPDMQSSFQMDGALDYNGRRLNVVVSLDKPMDLVNGKTSQGEVRLTTDQVSATLTGTLSTTGTLLDGKIDAGIENFDDLLAWIGQPQKEKLPFTKVSFNSQAQMTANMLKLQGAKLLLDEIEAQGNVQLNLAAAKPDIVARLSVNKLNLDRFTGGAVKPGDASGDAQSNAAASTQKGWATTPIDFSGLKAVNADLVLNTQGFSLKGADVGPCTLTVLLKDGVLSFKSSQATFFGGTFTSNFNVDAAGSVPNMAFIFSMTDVQAKPVLTTFANFKKLSGAADANVSVTASGNNQKAIIGSLAGTGAVNFKNGALEGIDLVNIAKMIQSRLGEMGVGEGKTDFVDMGGTFTIAGGVATNNDFKMKGPLVQATGSGTVDLPQKQVKYRVLPVLTASSAVEGASGITIPVDIAGPFSNVKIKPDYKSAVTKALSDPSQIKDTAKTIGKEGKALLKDIKKDPNQALQNLLGGSLFGKKTAPADNSGATAP